MGEIVAREIVEPPAFYTGVKPKNSRMPAMRNCWLHNIDVLIDRN